jgi:HEAT repeat protein
MAEINYMLFFPDGDKMKDKFKNAECRKVTTTKLNAYIISILFFTCMVLSIFGCNKSLQTAFVEPGGVDANRLEPEAVRIIREGLEDDNPLIRSNAIEVVVAAKRIKLVPKVQRLLRDEFVPVRFAAILAIGDMEYRLAESSVRQLLNDEDENVRIAAVYTMKKLGYPESLEPLSKAITSSDQTVRANAALLLGKSGDKSTLKFLYWALQRQDSDDKVRFNAAEAIARLGDERIYPKLWTMLISTYADDRVMGIKAMASLGTSQARNSLITMLDDDVLEVRLAAAEQLGVLKDTTGKPEVLDVFKKNLTAGLGKEDRERVNVRTALAIGQIGTDALTKFLPQFLSDESKVVRIAAANAVFQCIKSH